MGAIGLALVYALATAALSYVAHWLVKDGPGSLDLGALGVLALAAILARPFLYTGHIHVVTRAVAAACDNAAKAGEPTPGKLAALAANVMAILTRDGPTVVVLCCAMGWQAGAWGAVAALALISGLLIARPARRLGLWIYTRRYGRTDGAVDPVQGALGHRFSRAWAEVGAESMLTALVALMVAWRLAGQAWDADAMGGMLVTALLMAAPLRRIGRVITQWSSAGRDGGDGVTAPLPARVAVVGEGQQLIFGLTSETYLERHYGAIVGKAAHDPGVLVARADVVATEPVLRWLAEAPGRMLADETGAPVIGVVPPDLVPLASSAIAERRSSTPGLRCVHSGAQDQYVRKLRRREPIEHIDLRHGDRASAERRLFDLVYKGVTDVVTRYLWPAPAFAAVRVLAACRVPPNAVTLFGIAMMLAASALFAQGLWAWGLAAAWLMTFLDTVDGKLARVTGTSSRLGDKLDHVTDMIHPPVWYLCIFLGLQATDPSPAEGGALHSCLVIVGAYVTGRLAERVFKRRFGFNGYMWRPVDSALRTVIARRNTNLAILTAGALLGQAQAGFAAVAVWSVATIGFQVVRTLHAFHLDAAGQSPTPWQTDPEPFEAPAPTPTRSIAS